MFLLNKICCLCLCNKSDLKLLFDVDSDGVSHYNKLTSSIAEMNFEGMNNHRLICEECCIILNTVYNFRQMCLRNKTKLITYISQLLTSGHVSGTSIPVRGIEHTKMIVTEEIEIKSETEVTNNNIEDRLNPQVAYESQRGQNNIASVAMNQGCVNKEEYNFSCKVETEDRENGSEYTDIKVEDVEPETKEGDYAGHFGKVFIDNTLGQRSSETDMLNMVDSESEEDFTATPPDISNVDSESPMVMNLIPAKSKFQYENVYNLFNNWRAKKKVDKVTECVLLAYFEEKSKSVKSSTLWSTYSMIKATLNINEKIDISKFPKLVPYLKKKSVGYRAKKSKTLTREQINRFLTEARDDDFLMIKVVLIMGISGACRRDELVNMMVDDIEDVGSVLIVKPSAWKMNVQRTFIVTNLGYIELYRKYIALRPSNISSRRLFLKYNNGRCVNQVVGIHKIGTMPSLIARYLQLPNVVDYTGHCFRRTSAILRTDSGADIQDYSGGQFVS